MTKDYVINNKTLMDEWDYEKNNALGLFPDKLTCGSGKRAWWKCQKCGNEWMTRIYVRTALGCGCPECMKKKISQALRNKSK